MGLLSFIVGLLAVAAALRAERSRYAGLPGFARRVWLVQGLMINLVVMLVLSFSLQPLAGKGPATWALVAALYGAGFFLYSRSNIRWAIAKFHAEPEAEAAPGTPS